MNNAQLKWRTPAKVALVVSNIFLLFQLVAMYQTEYQLVTPLVPSGTVWEINRQYAFIALVFTGVNIISLLLFYWKKYMPVVIIVSLALIISRFVHI